MAVNITDPRQMTGADVTGRGGEKLGKVETVYLDNETQRPEWAAVKTGLFGGHVSLVPLATAQYDDGHLQVPYTKDEVQNAPHHDPGQELSVEDERQLFTHYGVDYGGDTATARSQDTPTGGDTGMRDERAGAGDRDGREGTVGHDTSGPTTDHAMTRSEEELHVGTTERETGRARLRKYVVTEDVEQTVPVRREEVRVEREPITDANAGAAMDGPAISEEEHEVVLHEEEVVVDKRAVPKERVRLDKDTVTEQREVSEGVRKEQIEVLDADGEPAEGRDGVRGTDEGLGH
jgi:uncharacterized protein (TIGR02271 family)